MSAFTLDPSSQDMPPRYHTGSYDQAFAKKRCSTATQAIEKETTPGKQRSIVSLVTHKQRRAVELLPSIMLAKRLLGEVPVWPTHVLYRTPSFNCRLNPVVLE